MQVTTETLPSMRVASETLRLIDEAIEADGGAKFRESLRSLLPKMEDAYRGESKPFRKHLGASLIGRDCSRELWYSYHWATIPTFEPRILRLFNRGHLEEARFLALLQLVPNVQLWYETEDGGQFTFSDVGGHFGSSLDGVVMGLPELPAGVPAYAEFKTSSRKIFDKVAKNGVQNEKGEHFTQMQVCMHEMKLPFALYMMVCKDTDRLHAEIVTYDAEHATRTVERAEMIIYSSEPLPQIHPSAGFFKCKFCSHLAVCKGEATPEVNCRTCAHSSPSREGDGKWECTRGHTDFINSDDGMYGCGEHVFNPHALNGVTFHGGDPDGRHADIELRSGERMLQGPDHMTSLQLQERGL